MKHDTKTAQLRDAIGLPKGSVAAAQIHGAIFRSEDPMLWADGMHCQLRGGLLAPAHKSESPRKLRAIFRAIRILQAGTEKEQKQGKDLSRFLETAWGLTRACVAIGGNDRDTIVELREQWGDAQLPPVDAFAQGIAADEALIQAVVRRLG
jgi:hypothetical protein